MKTWFEIQAKAKGPAEIFIYDLIGMWGITAKDFMNEYQQIGKDRELLIRIHSDGGDFFDAIPMYNILARHPASVTVIIDGLAASAASVIAMAGNKVIMPENSWLMIHNMWTFTVGMADDFREIADLMDRWRNSLVSAYVNKTKQSAEKIIELLDAVTWLDAKQALDLGFADEISEPVKMAASANLGNFKTLPDALKAKAAPEPEPAPAPEPEPAPSAIDLERAKAEAAAEASQRLNSILEICAKAGVSDMAPELFGKGLSIEDVTKRFADADTIRSICAAAKLPLRAATYIRAGLGVQEVRDELFKARLAMDEVEIDNKLAPEGAGYRDSGSQKIPNAAEIYARRKQGINPQEINARYAKAQWRR